MRGERRGNSSIVGMHKNIMVEAEDPEQEVDKHERGNSAMETTPKVTVLCNLGALLYKIKCKWETQLNRTALRVEGEQEIVFFFLMFTGPCIIFIVE